MQRRFAWLAGLVLGLGLLITQRAEGFITNPIPLRDILSTEPYVFVAKIEALDSDKPSMVLKVSDQLKGKVPFEKLNVNLTGDALAKKLDHRAQLLKRVATGLPLIVTVGKKGETYIAFCYTNGTWFHMIGYVGDKPEMVRWSFAHCEPYLRKTFKGTTEELKQVIVDALAKKKDPPGIDAKEEPGLGPEIKSDDKPKKDKEQESALPRPSGGGPVFAVIPLVVGGPIAILALLFPAVFGGALIVLRRWQILLSVVTIASTLYTLHTWGAEFILDYWRVSPLALWTMLFLVSLVGAIWAWRRQRAAFQDGSVLPPPRLLELITLGILSVLGVAAVAFCVMKGGFAFLLNPPWKDQMVVWITVWIGTLYAFLLRWTMVGAEEAARIAVPAPEIVKEVQPTSAALRPASALTPAVSGPSPGPSRRSGWLISPETAMLVIFAFGSAAYAASTLKQDGGRLQGMAARGASRGAPSEDSGQRQWDIAWTFEAPDRGGMYSSPLVTEDAIYVGAMHGAGFSGVYGKVYCIDRATHKEKWSFDNGRAMRAVFSSPCVADGRLYIGEGFHQDFGCKLYCLKADTGEKLWEFATNSHTESSPCVAGGKVFFGAGDDGVYCLDGATGKQVWHFEGLHVDANPTVVGNRLYCASGVGDVQRELEVFCLNVETGKPLWRMPADLPVWGSPTVAGRHVFFGLGNGNFLQSDSKPAGAVLCVEADTGHRVWRYDVPDGVLVKPAVDERQVYFGCRDGFCYCVDRKEGRPLWKRDMKSPVLASPVLAGCSCCGANQSLYVLGSTGLVGCLSPRTGEDLWPEPLDISAQSRTQARLFSTPAVIPDATDARRRWLVFGTELDNLITPAASLYCIEDR